MPTEIAFPFRIAEDGSIASSTDPDQQISEHVQALIGTEPGERVVVADYGVPLRGMLFDPNSSLVADEVARQTQAGIERYEPGVLLTAVKPVADQDEMGIAKVEVDFVRRESGSTPSSLSRNVNTAIVSVGGHVSEVVRG